MGRPTTTLRPRAPTRGPSTFGRAVGYASAHRATWANVGAHGRTWARSRGGISARTRLGRGAAGTPAPCGARGRRRKGRGWWASHHRRGLPRPPRYGSSAPQAGQWRSGARIERRAIVADAATASGASALMHHSTGENPRKGAKPGRGNTVARRGRPGAQDPGGDPRSALRASTRRAPLAEFRERHSTRVLAGSNGAPHSMSARTWSSVRSRDGWAGCSEPSPGHTWPYWPT
jgi:hypothetical protein